MLLMLATHVSVFVILVFLVWQLFRFLKVSRFSFVFALAHFLFICAVFVEVYMAKNEAQFQLIWLCPGIIDLPISILLYFIRKFMCCLGDAFWYSNVGHDVSEVYIPAVFYAVFGSFQYYLIGRVVEIIVGKRAKKRLK